MLQLTWGVCADRSQRQCRTKDSRKLITRPCAAQPGDQPQDIRESDPNWLEAEMLKQDDDFPQRLVLMFCISYFVEVDDLDPSLLDERSKEYAGDLHIFSDVRRSVFWTRWWHDRIKLLHWEKENSGTPTCADIISFLAHQERALSQCVSPYVEETSRISLPFFMNEWNTVLCKLSNEINNVFFVTRWLSLIACFCAKWFHCTSNMLNVQTRSWRSRHLCIFGFNDMRCNV